MVKQPEMGVTRWHWNVRYQKMGIDNNGEY